MKIPLVLALITLVLLSGCTDVIPKDYVCADGTVVNDPNFCPKTVQYICADGSVVDTAAECNIRQQKVPSSLPENLRDVQSSVDFTYFYAVLEEQGCLERGDDQTTQDCFTRVAKENANVTFCHFMQYDPKFEKSFLQEYANLIDNCVYNYIVEDDSPLPIQIRYESCAVIDTLQYYSNISLIPSCYLDVGLGQVNSTFCLAATRFDNSSAWEDCLWEYVKSTKDFAQCFNFVLTEAEESYYQKCLDEKAFYQREPKKTI